MPGACSASVLAGRSRKGWNCRRCGRKTTIKALVDPEAKPEDFFKPGHCFPLVAKDGGVLERNGHTEASVTLARLAGEAEVAYICEILKEDGHMARRPEFEYRIEPYGKGVCE